MEKAVSKLLHERSCIMIAHRLATVQRADHILILDGWACAGIGKKRAFGCRPEFPLQPITRDRVRGGVGMTTFQYLMAAYYVPSFPIFH